MHVTTSHCWVSKEFAFFLKNYFFKYECSGGFNLEFLTIISNCMMNKYCPSCCWCMFFIDSLHVHGLTCLDVTFIILFFYFLPLVCLFELVYFCGGPYDLKVQCWIAIILGEYFSLKTVFLVIKFPTSCHECCCVHNFILTYNFMEMLDQFAYLMGKQFFWQSKLITDLCISLPFTVVSIFSYALYFDANYFLITCCPKKKKGSSFLF